MMRNGVMCLGVCLLLGCGGGNSRARNETTTAATTSAGEKANAAPYGAGRPALADTPQPTTKLRRRSPVIPRELVSLVRLSNPEQFINALTEATQFPLDWRRLLNARVPGLVDVIAWNTSVDAAVMIDPTPQADDVLRFLTAVSVGGRDLEAMVGAASRFAAVRKRNASVYELDQPPCTISPARGDAPVRIVCGSERRDVNLLQPYMAEGLPLEQLSQSSLYAEFLFDPIRRRYSDRIKGALDGMDRASAMLNEKEKSTPVARDVLGKVRVEAMALVQALQKGTFELDFAESGDALLTESSLRFRKSKESWFTGALEELSDAVASPPEMFWLLPDDSIAAGFAQAYRSKRIEDFAAGVRAMLAKLMEGSEISEALRPKVLALVEQTFRLGRHGQVWATGRPGESITSGAGAKPGVKKSKPAQALPEELEIAWSGWRVAGWRDERGEVADYVRSLVELYNDTGFRKFLHKYLEPEFAFNEWPRVRIVPSSKREQLPKGSFAVEISIHGKALQKLIESNSAAAGAEKTKSKTKSTTGKMKSLTGTLVMIPSDTPGTNRPNWLAFSLDPALAYAKLHEVLGEKTAAQAGPKNDGDTEFADVAALRQSKALVGGFYRVPSVPLTSSDGSRLDGEVLMKRLLLAPASASNGTLIFTVNPSVDGQNVALTGGVQIPTSALQQLVMFTQALRRDGT